MVETNPFLTDFAWGYRLVGKADFFNVFAGVNMAARLIFSHDVNGITPDPMFLFTEGKNPLLLALILTIKVAGDWICPTTLFGAALAPLI